MEKDIKHIDAVKGGKGAKSTIESIAKKHSVSEKEIEDQIEIGILVEYEHSNNKDVATDIAFDHVTEHADYYTKLINSGLVDEEKAIKRAKELGVIKDKKEMKESIEIENPTTVTLDITVKDKKVGEITIATSHKDLGDHCLEIKDFPFFEKVNLILVGKNVINNLWTEFPEHEKIIVEPRPGTLSFWEKLGFYRLNNEYLVALRGH